VFQAHYSLSWHEKAHSIHHSVSPHPRRLLRGRAAGGPHHPTPVLRRRGHTFLDLDGRDGWPVGLSGHPGQEPGAPLEQRLLGLKQFDRGGVGSVLSLGPLPEFHHFALASSWFSMHLAETGDTALNLTPSDHFPATKSKADGQQTSYNWMAGGKDGHAVRGLEMAGQLNQ